MNEFTFGLKGMVTVEVINDGKTVAGPVKSANLWLNQGLDNAAAHPICELFEVAVKGTGDDITKEDLTGTTNTYSIAGGSTAVSRAAGARDFTPADVGKLMRFTNGKEFLINGYTSPTIVSVQPPATATITTLKITLYGVSQTGLETEVGRTDTYSMVSGENATTTAANVRTFKRTFVFDGEDIIKEVIARTDKYEQAGTFVNRLFGTRDFSPGDIGKTITFAESGETTNIVGFIDGAQVSVSTDATVPEGPIIITYDSDLKEALTGTYSRTGNVVTRLTGVRNFVADDVGKYIHFDTDNVESKITGYTDATRVNVDISGFLAEQTAALYGFTDYREIGFSHTDEFGSNLNIRVLLSAAVRAYRSTPLRTSDQLKVTYQCTLTVTPSASVALNLATLITDPGNQMSGNKNGDYAIETFATSTVGIDGNTDVSLVDLEPYYEGFAGLSLDSAVLAPFTGKVRNNALATVPLLSNGYNPGDFTRVFTGTFALNDAINSNWRSLMIVDPDSGLAAFTFLYDAVQHKDGEHTFTISFRKTWGRDLS